jgi:alpha-glucosidase
VGIAYGLLYDNLAATTFDLGREYDNYLGRYRYYTAEDGDIDYYFIYGPSLEQVVERYSALVGRPSLPPRWSLGYLGSTMSYTDAPNAQEQLQHFVELCQEHRVPCDLFHLSSGYTLGEDGKRYVFTWSRSRIPDPAGMVEHFHRAGIKLAANVKPCLLTTHPRYQEVAAAGGFVKNAETGAPEISDFWKGDAGSFIDFTNPAGYDWWRQQVERSLLSTGIDATWNDNNEYVIWDDEARCDGFGTPVRIGLIRPLHALLMTRASYEAQRKARPDERPYLICRSGCAGIQRYAQTWSGDNVTSWHTLRWNIPMGLSSSLSGIPNIGHDVGGFTGYRTEPELFVRWVQNGIFHPRFTIHSWHLDGTVNEPWMYPEVLPLIREAVEFRYRLLPYLYTLLFEAARTGHPMIRPLVYAFPEDSHCHTESFDFLLGPSLLVASVLAKGERTRSVYLPDSQMWCNFHTGEWWTGGQTVEVDAPLDRIPLFVSAGGIIPMGKVMPHIGGEEDDVRQAFVFPHPRSGRGKFTLVEDDGISQAYLQGGYTEVEIEVAADPDEVTLRVSKSHAGYPLPYRTIEFVLPHGERRPARAPGRSEMWTDRMGRQHIVIPVSSPGPA